MPNAAHPAKHRIPVLNPEFEGLLRAIEHNTARVIDHADKIVSAIQDTITYEQWAKRKSMVALDASGAGQLQWQVPLGFGWLLTRCTVTSSQNGQCQFFVDTTNPQDMAEEISSSLLYSDSFANNIFVPGGSTLFAVFTGAGAFGQATVNLQLRVIRERPFPNTPTHTYRQGA